jgi:hypothetical protein
MSHHSSSTDPERNQLMHEAMKKLLGEFPDGKLNAADEGAVAMAVGHENGRVVLEFPKPVKWIGFTGDEAIELAQLLIEYAKQAGLTKPAELKL